MTSEQFQRDYQLLDRVTEGAVETYHAQATSGAMVMVHYLRGSTAENSEIYGLIERLDSERKRKVLISADVDGVPAIITRFILDFRTLRDWLGASTPVVATEVATPAPPPPIAPPPPKSEPGEFTRMFSSASPAPEPVSPAPTAPPPPKKEPGEFTRLFGQSPTEQPTAAAPPPRAKEPGEFTRLFGGESSAGTPPPPPPSAVPPAAPPPPAARGEFTAMFGAPSPPAAEGPRAADVPSAPPPELRAPALGAPPKPQQGPGEFTKSFGALQPAEPSLSPPKAPPPAIFSAPPPADELSFGTTAPTPPAGGSYTRMFGAPALPAEPNDPLFPDPPASSADPDQYFERLTKGVAPAPAPAPLPGPPPPPIYTGQSEFTRIVSALPAPPVASPPPPPIAPAPAPARSNRILLFGLIAVVVTTIVFVVLLIALG
jgi:hypothetical protein